MYYKTASIILNSEQKSNSVSDIFIAQPEKSKEELAGKLFVLAEIESQKTNALKIVNFLINNLNLNYYQNDKIILRERIKSITVESIFETSLAKTNRDLVNFLERERIKISPYAFNITVCVLYEGEIHFSTIGKNKTLLIYKEKKEEKTRKGRKKNGVIPPIETITEYKIADVGGTKEKRRGTVNINRLFSDAVNGKIPAGGSFLIINEALSEYTSNKQLIKIVTTISPAGAAEQIKNNLEKINSFVSFLGIIIKSTTTPAFDNKIEEEDEAEEDYSPKITKMEEETESILKPSGIINIKKLIKSVSGKFRPKISNDVLDISGRNIKKDLTIKERMFFQKRTTLFKKILAASLKTFNLFKILFIFIFKKIVNKKTLLIILNNIKRFFGIKKEKSIAGSNVTRAFVAIIILLSISFFSVTAVKDKKNKEEAIKVNFNKSIHLIEQNQNEIIASLLYGNETAAKKIIDKNSILLKKFSEEEKNSRNDIKKLFTKHSELINKIRHIIEVNNPEKITDFSNLNNKVNTKNIIFFNQKLYCADPKGKSIYKRDLIENITTSLYKINENIREMQLPTKNGDNGIYYLDKKHIIGLSLDEKTSLFKIALPGTISDITAMEAYGNKLYLMNKRDGQIYKFTKQGKSFIGGSKWLKEKENLSKAVDLFIDGNIYIFYKDGKIKRYLKGVEMDFPIEKTYTPITKATSFSILNKFIYILEPDKKRVVLFDKNGDFSRQYIFNSLNDIRGFAVDKNEENIYILDGNSIYKTNIE